MTTTSLPAKHEESVKEMEKHEIEIGNFTLADAIREGASLTPQITGCYITDKGACALGAAWLSIKAHHLI